MATPSESTFSAGTLSQATPAMRQYLEAKRQHRDAIVLFRMGDFYETFFEDALVASRALDLTLTSRSRDSAGTAIPMCGVPYHALDGYLARLVKKGFRVAICEQVEDPRKAKGLVRREVVRVVSPGTFTDAGYLDAREPAFLMALAPRFTLPRRPGRGSQGSAGVAPAAGAPPNPGQPAGLIDSDGVSPAPPVHLDALGVALVDLSTGEFTSAEYAGKTGLQALSDEMGVLRPREIVVPDDFALAEHFPTLAEAGTPVTSIEPWGFEAEHARACLIEQFRTRSLDAFGLEAHPLAIRAAGGLVRYLRDTQKVDLAHVRAASFRQTADALVIDPVTLRHLEVVEAAEGGRAGSLLDEIDRTVTAMGGRMLRAWLLRPLLALERVRDRLDAVEDFAFKTTERGKFREALKAVQDLERLVARAALGSAGPRDLVALKVSLGVVPRLRLILQDLQAPLLRSLAAELDDLPELRASIEAAVVDDPPVLARDGGFIRDGFDARLDELRGISRGGKQVIARMEEQERARTGIPLKIRYNRVFGYYIEVTKSNLHAVPADYHRKQTIAGGERYITPALKEYEEKVVGADEKILEREIELFEGLRQEVAGQAPRIQDTARAVAALDALAALAETATNNNYTKPYVHDGDEIVVVDGRHPVVERRTADAFVPNDTQLNSTTHQLIILTGPNMGGKSTYLRQTAIICLLGQVGSFVPAREAKLALVDRIFARVGASDNIARGQSTFMVEMQETANILHAATARSLVILDEIGRGTATFDGLSIAWAVAEHLATNTRARPKTIFATHYHELTDLADGIAGVMNFHVDAREWHDEIIFLRKVVPGRSDRSYGIQVARLAGLPRSVVDRAREILGALEHDELARGGRPSISRTPTEPQQQLGLFQSPSPAGDRLVDRVLAIDPDRMTPMEALALLAELKKDAQDS